MLLGESERERMFLVDITCSALSMVEREAGEAQAGESGGVKVVLGILKCQ